MLKDTGVYDVFKKGYDLDIKGNTKLHSAVLKGDLKEVNNLLQSGIDPNEANEKGFTPLHYGAILDNLEIVTALLNENRGIYAVDSDYGNTALHWAAYGNFVGVAKEILSRINDDGYTALHIAAAKGNVEMVKAITNKMVELTKKGTHAKIDETDFDGNTPLDIAQEGGYQDIVNLLEEKQKTIRQLKQQPESTVGNTGVANASIQKSP